jgi:hypothetical protein
MVGQKESQDPDWDVSPEQYARWKPGKFAKKGFKTGKKAWKKRPKPLKAAQKAISDPFGVKKTAKWAFLYVAGFLLVLVVLFLVYKFMTKKEAEARSARRTQLVASLGQAAIASQNQMAQQVSGAASQAAPMMM